MDDTFLEQREEFRENLTLGVTRTLKKINGVKDVMLYDHGPSDNIAITSWEQRYSTTLPNEIKNFYLATDGLKLTWNLRYGGQVITVGNIYINRISDLRRIAGLRHSFDTDHPTLLDLEVAPTKKKKSDTSLSTKTRQRPQFGLRWKMFELDGCSGKGKVVLVFPPKPETFESSTVTFDVVPAVPEVWFLDRAYEWHYLAPNFTTYVRMMLVHLGLPQWQALFTPIGPTPWAKQIINLIAPHLLDSVEEETIVEDEEDIPLNILDPSIFRIKNKSSKKPDENRGE